MLKIGEFARICSVSPQTLRYYDSEGLLCPNEIDPATGYRYYALNQLENFRRIQTYKDAGFALEEIKVLLRGDPDSQNVLMAKKRQEINREVDVLRAKLSLLDSLGRQRERLGEKDFFEIGEQRFEDHPEVHGRWELCGQLIAPIGGDPPPPSATLVPCHREDVFPLISLLPGGAPWWMFCWSRGVLYTVSAYKTLIPNPYTLWEVDGERYMTVCYVTPACLYQGGEPIWLLYRQTEHAALTELESRAFKPPARLGDVIRLAAEQLQARGTFARQTGEDVLGVAVFAPGKHPALGGQHLAHRPCAAHFRAQKSHARIRDARHRRKRRNPRRHQR